MTLSAFLQKYFVERQLRHLDPLEPLTVQADDSLDSTIGKMVEAKIGSLVVTDKAGLLTGILTEGDIFARGKPHLNDPSIVTVQEVMTPNPSALRVHSSISRAIFELSTRKIRHLPIVDSSKFAIGVVSSTDLIDYIVQKCQSDEMYIDSRLDETLQSFVWSIANPHPDILHKESTIEEALDVLLKKRSRILLVRDKDTAKLVGIFSERDYLRRVYGKHELDSTLEEVMTPLPLKADGAVTLQEACEMFFRGDMRHLPIVHSVTEEVRILPIGKAFDVLSDTILGELES